MATVHIMVCASKQGLSRTGVRIPRPAARRLLRLEYMFRQLSVVGTGFTELLGKKEDRLEACWVLFKNNVFIYLRKRDRDSEREHEWAGRGRSGRPTEQPKAGFDPRTLGSPPETKAAPQPTEPPRHPRLLGSEGNLSLVGQEPMIL